LKNKDTVRHLAHIALTRVATLGFLGYSPFAPGTIGSLFALATFLCIDLSPYAHFSIIIIVALVGTYASSAAEKVLREKDSKKIIIDEFAGFYVSVFCIPKTVGFIIAAFLLFRFFDILKPLFIAKLETTLSGGIGVMADDILAGIYTNIVLQVFVLVFT
jgi:phosphatidylglycerophosphatase A